jgi:hypothetical protein
MARLTAAQRKAMPNKDFGLPGGTKSSKGKPAYPMKDKSHAEKCQGAGEPGGERGAHVDVDGEDDRRESGPRARQTEERDGDGREVTPVGRRTLAARHADQDGEAGRSSGDGGASPVDGRRAP